MGLSRVNISRPRLAVWRSRTLRGRAAGAPKLGDPPPCRLRSAPGRHSKQRDYSKRSRIPVHLLNTGAGNVLAQFDFFSFRAMTSARRSSILFYARSTWILVPSSSAVPYEDGPDAVPMPLRQRKRLPSISSIPAARRHASGRQKSLLGRGTVRPAKVRQPHRDAKLDIIHRCSPFHSMS
jgi:hypothetical protein